PDRRRRYTRRAGGAGGPVLALLVSAVCLSTAAGISAPASRGPDAGVFLTFLEREDVGRINPEKGRFRSYLITSFQHYVSGEHARAHAAKRGGTKALLSLDLAEAERQYALEPFHDIT